MSYLLSQGIDRSGMAPAYSVATTGGDTFTPGVNAFLHIVNASGSTVTVTILSAWYVVPDVPVGPMSVSIPNGQGRMIGSFPQPWFTNPTTVICSPSAGVTLGAFALQDVSTPGAIENYLLPSLTLYPDVTLFPKT